MSFNDDEIIIFDNQYNTNHNTNHNIAYNYDTSYNEDVPPELINTNSVQINSDFSIIQDLFFDNKDINSGRTNITELLEPHEIDEQIEIYKNTNEKKGEFSDVKFRANLLPFSFQNLLSLTELTIKNCKLDEINCTPPNLEKFICNNCNLKYVSFKNISPMIRYINLANNDIELVMDFEHLKYLKYLNLDNNKISYINDLSESLEVISLKSNILTSTKFLMQNLRELYVANNRIENIEYLLDSIEILDISKNNIGMIALLPSNLRILTAFNCKLTKILCKFPPLLENIDLYNNQLTQVPDFNDAMRWTDLSSNELLYLPYNLKNVDYLDISSNPNIAILPTEKNWQEFMHNMKIDGKSFMMDNQNNTETDATDINYIDRDEDFNYINIDKHNKSRYNFFDTDNDDNIVNIANSSSSDSLDSSSDDNLDEDFKEKLLHKYDTAPPRYEDIQTTTETYNIMKNVNDIEENNVGNNNIRNNNIRNNNTQTITITNNTNNNTNNTTNNNNDERLLEIIQNIRNKKREETQQIIIKPTRYVKKTKLYTV